MQGTMGTPEYGVVLVRDGTPARPPARPSGPSSTAACCKPDASSIDQYCQADDAQFLLFVLPALPVQRATQQWWVGLERVCRGCSKCSGATVVVTRWPGELQWDRVSSVQQRANADVASRFDPGRCVPRGGACAAVFAPPSFVGSLTSQHEKCPGCGPMRCASLPSAHL